MIDWEGELTCAIEELEKLRMENKKLKEKILRYEEKEDNSCFEVPKDSLEKLLWKTTHALE